MDVVDSLADVTTFATVAWAWLVDLGPRLLGAVLILVIGLILARYISRGVARLLKGTTRVEPTLVPILKAVTRYAIAIVVIVAALGQLGVQTASVLAALGAAGIAIGLALQGTLSNIAAGIMILWLRPFRAGDSIQAGTVSGSVEEMGLFNARLRTGDGVYLFVPNSELWSKTIINYTRNPTRQVTVDFSLEYGASLGQAREILLKLAERHHRILKDPMPQVVTQSLTATAVGIQLRDVGADRRFRCGEVGHDRGREGRPRRGRASTARCRCRRSGSSTSAASRPTAQEEEAPAQALLGAIDPSLRRLRGRSDRLERLGLAFPRRVTSLLSAET